MILVALVGLLVANQESPRPAIDKALVERFRSLTPEQKARLRERVEALRKLSPAERRRLAENLDKFRALAPERQKAVRDRLERMSPEERRQAMELAAGFVRWMNARYGPLQFPRQAFFRWASARRPQEFQGLKVLEPGPRIDALLRLAHEFRGAHTQQLRQHARRHGCAASESLQDLEDLTFEDFWKEADAVARRCPRTAPGPRPEKRDR
jgi:hypothetical protein